VDFSGWWPNASFQGYTNSDEISSYQFDTKKKTFYYQKADLGKY